MIEPEIECRFLEIDKEALVKKLHELGAEDLGEHLLEEVIMYDKDLVWKEANRFVRLRTYDNKTILSYKEHREQTVDGTHEIEFEVPDSQKAKHFLEHIGLVAERYQEKNDTPLSLIMSLLI